MTFASVCCPATPKLGRDLLIAALLPSGNFTCFPMLALLRCLL